MTTIFDVYAMSDLGLMKVIGEKIKSKRIGRRLTRDQVAVAAGVSLSSVKSAENGGNVSIIILIQILRALEALDLLESFWQEEPLSPIAIAEAQKKMRQPKRIRKSNPIPIKIESEW